jgi:hypothetical protein
MSNIQCVENCPEVKAAGQELSIQLNLSVWPVESSRRLKELIASSERCNGPKEIGRTVVDLPFARIRHALGRPTTKEVVEYECCNPIVVGSDEAMSRQA